MTLPKPLAEYRGHVASLRAFLVAVALAGFTSRSSAHPGHWPALATATFAPDDVLLVAASSSPDSPRRFNGTGEDRVGGRQSDALKNDVSITVEGGYRFIRANGIPDHPPGQFPNRGNPNRIGAQHYEFRVPVNPQVAARPTPSRMQPFGVAVNGVVFDPGAAEWWRGDRNWQYEPLSGAINLGVDQNNAHVQPTGAYHYHAIPTGLVERLTGGKPKMALVGWAADGFPMYGPWGYSDSKNPASKLKKLQSSYRVKQGTRPGGPGGKYDGSFVADHEYVNGTGDLDECNGRTGVTPEFPQGTYYYVLTENFPYVPRMYRGTPDPSFMIHGPGGGLGPGGRGGPGGFGPPRGGRPSGFDRDRGFPPPHSDRQDNGGGRQSVADSSRSAADCTRQEPTNEEVRLEYPRMESWDRPPPPPFAGGFPPPPPGWGPEAAFAFAAFPPPPPPFPRGFPYRLEDWTEADWDSFFEQAPPPSAFAHHGAGLPRGWPPPPPHWGWPPPPMFW